jgi:hypothetical protein
MNPSSNIGRAGRGERWLTLVIGLLLASALVAQLLAAPAWGHDSYPMTESLINYAGGFVRRGLPGSLFGMISEATGLGVNLVAIGCFTICYLALVAWFLRKASSVFPPVLLLSCVMLGFPAYQESVVRKDCLGLLLLLACLRLDGGTMHRAAAFALINLLAIIGILSHEAFAFYAVAPMILCGVSFGGTVTGAVKRASLLLPAGCALLLTVIHHGTPSIAQAVHDSLLPLWRSLGPGEIGLEHPAASIEALGWSSSEGMALSLHLLGSGLYQPLAWLMVMTVSVLLILRLMRMEAGQSGTRRGMAALLAVQFLCISPLFLLGVDYGRWLFLWFCGAAMMHITRHPAPQVLAGLVDRLAACRSLNKAVRALPVRQWQLLVFGVPVCWSLEGFLTASPLGRHLLQFGPWFLGPR